MLDVFHIAKPQGCDIQIFNGMNITNLSTTQPRGTQSWVKPRGVSNIYMLLIGAGGTGTGTTGGGSGAVTVWYGSAQNVPDNLVVLVPLTAAATSIYPRSLQNSFTAANCLLIANSGANNTGGAAMTANQFCASGFFQSIAGQNGSNGDPTASSTTFLGGGSGSSITTANYGYGLSSVGAGYFQLQPIIVGVGGSNQKGGIGCGGGYNSSPGGPGMVLIASW